MPRIKPSAKGGYNVWEKGNIVLHTSSMKKAKQKAGSIYKKKRK